MRKKLRLNWRALALLGALLLLTVDWSGLVYAMPMTLPTTMDLSHNHHNKDGSIATIIAFIHRYPHHQQHNDNKLGHSSNRWLPININKSIQIYKSDVHAQQEIIDEEQKEQEEEDDEKNANLLHKLSRTERSVTSQQLYTTVSTSIGDIRRTMISAGSSHHLIFVDDTYGNRALIVRRSSDNIKSKRLINNSKNNLDRNERSTLSHLSGPSRKIQLYIKNRFIQLMPDGTVNGTQDEQSEYSSWPT